VRRWVVAAAVVLCGPVGVTRPSSARAQARTPAAEDPAALAAAARAQAHVDQGTRRFKQKRYDEAVAEFLQAEPLIVDPAARAVVRHNIARCYELQRKPEEAVEALDRYLELPDEPGAQRAARDRRSALIGKHFATLRVVGAARGGARCVLERSTPPAGPVTPTTCGEEPRPVLAGTYVVRLEGPGPEPIRTETTLTLSVGQAAAPVLELPGWLRVETARENARVEVDGKRFGTGPVVEGPAPAGERAVTVRAAEQVLWRTTVTLVSGEVTRAVSPLTAPLPADEHGGATGPWAWVAAGGAAAGLAGATWYYLGAKQAVANGDAAVDDMAAARTRDRYDAAGARVRAEDDTARDARALSIGLGVVGLGLTGLATWLFLGTPPDAPESEVP
jgi:tetratricopeptide (TPR) repeat protein